MAKTYAGTYLYSKYSEYETKIINFIMTGEDIDKESSDFEDIVYDIKKRQVSNSLVKVLMSKKIHLIQNATPMDKAFKVFCAKDIKEPKNGYVVYIDVSNIIDKSNSGKYECNKPDILVAYLVDAMQTLIYYTDERRLVNNSKIISTGATAFSALYTHIVDYVAHISAMPDVKAKCKYLAAVYYMANILGKDPISEQTINVAKKIADISEREADIIHISYKKESFLNIKFFTDLVADVLHLPKLTCDIVVEKWMWVYGTGTVFSLELLPAFSNMITDAYVGCYINNQKTIEKIAGRSMVDFTKTILAIGADAV
jgi:hypothetical protein